MSDKPLQYRSAGAYAELQAKVQELEGENEDIREQKEELHDQYRGAIANAQHRQAKAEAKVQELEAELKLMREWMRQLVATSVTDHEGYPVDGVFENEFADNEYESATEAYEAYKKEKGCDTWAGKLGLANI